MDIVGESALIGMYARCGSILDAHAVFLKIQLQNIVSWTAMIGAYAQHGYGKEALLLYQQMHKQGTKLTEISFVTVLSACSILAEGQIIHAHVIKTGLESVTVVENALLTMYGRFGCVLVAWSLFDKMHAKNVVSWNAMIAACCQHGHGKQALQCFFQMEVEGMIPDKITFISVIEACASLRLSKIVHTCIVGSGFESDDTVGNALIHNYGKCGSLKHACSMFNQMHQHNVVSWNTMFAVYIQHGHATELFELFRQMQQEGVHPDKISFVSMISACVNREVLSEGKMIHVYIIENGFETDVVVGSALVNMYGKYGCIMEAWHAFDRLEERNVVTWNAMIAAYAQHGRHKEALHLFRKMQLEGVQPSESSYVSILSVCSHTGLVDEGM